MSLSLLQNIKSPKDLRSLTSVEELKLLAHEIRHFLLDTLSQIDHVHFSANLGVVELTVALHYVFDTPTDELFWDIGHQGYVHKMLTGRLHDLPNIRSKNGISGFLSMHESSYDHFGAGHAGTSISAALGAATASSLAKSNKHHVAIIGDASIASGMAFEALNHLADYQNLNLTIVLNDNNCSIDASVGGLSKYFQNLGSTQNTDSFFKALNLVYDGPVDGHDFNALLNAFKKSKAEGGIRIIHCKTEKGKGYQPSLLGSSAHWHAPGKFDKNTGASLKKTTAPRYQDIVAETLVQLAEIKEKIVAVTAGMLSGTSLNKFQEKFPNRCFDVGIAEQHAVTFSAGLATQGFLPYCVIYSTFLQRALDQVIHDVALQNLPVVFCVDRAGVVGHDGATHQGVFDISFLRMIPNLIIASPSTIEDLQNLLFTAQKNLKGPLVIRYPRGTTLDSSLSTGYKSIDFGKSKIINPGEKIMLIGIGTVVHELKKVQDLLLNHNLNVGICDAVFVKPLDTKLLLDVFNEYIHVVTIEEHALLGGFGSAILEFAADNNLHNKVLRIGIPDEFVEHATQAQQREQFALNAEGIASKILEWLITF